MHHLDQVGFNIKAAITCVLPLAQRVYTGDEEGRVVSFSFFTSYLLEMRGIGADLLGTVSMNGSACRGSDGCVLGSMSGWFTGCFGSICSYHAYAWSFDYLVVPLVQSTCGRKL